MKPTTSNITLNGARSALALAVVLALTLIASQSTQAQEFQVLYNFTGGADGSFPAAGLTMDGAGNLYGTDVNGGAGHGTAYRLQHKGSGWVFNPLYSFAGDSDGDGPFARLIFGADGALYSTTWAGGTGFVGTVFKLRPSPTACKTALCPWMKTTLYNFTGAPDGDTPYAGDLLFDPAGNIYGTTLSGGVDNNGAVYKLMPSGGGWTESVIYNFTGGDDGGTPYAGLVRDNAGNLYSTTGYGGQYGYGTVFELTYSAGSGWTEKVLYSFQDGTDGQIPWTGLTFDHLGNLYGATAADGAGGGGTIFELSPGSGGSWTFSTIYSFSGGFLGGPVEGSVLAMDGSGNLYGTTGGDGVYGCGSVFKLTPSNGSWAYSDLYDFTCGDDGGLPTGVIVDAHGNLYGATSLGGSGQSCHNGCGVVWEITP